MHTLLWSFAAVATLLSNVADAAPPKPAADPCVAIGGKKWVAPADVRACFQSFPLNETRRSNVLEVVSKTFNFQTSINYQIRAPAPFSQDVHVDIASELKRIGAQHYASELDFHIDLSRTIKRLQDGHTVYQDLCFDSSFLTFLPFPVVAVTEKGIQTIRIAPEAFNVSSTEFADEIAEWQQISGLDFSKYSGAIVLLINGQDPWNAINANAQITGSFQALTTRQNKFFSSYVIGTPFTYRMGDFAQQSLPLTDKVTLTVIRTGRILPETITVPYRSRIGASTVAFTDGPSFRAGNCVAKAGTNGVNVNDQALVSPFVQGFQPPISAKDRKQPMNTIINEAPLQNIALPPSLSPTGPVSGAGGLLFFELDDKKTGVLALTSFSTGGFDQMETQLLTGLQKLKADGMTRLVVDITNNGGGFICIAHWLHRIIIGPAPTTEPQAGLDTKARDQEIARLIVEKIVAGADPQEQLLYNGINWRSANGTNFTPQTDWLEPPVNLKINGRADAFSQRLGQECQPFDMTPPTEQIFAPQDIILVNNGLCASSCALFTIALSKHYNVTTVVVGGKQGTVQQYTGTVGGQSSDFSTMDTEVKSTGLKNNSLAPPDFITNSVQGITWRLGFGINDPTQPEEWQEHFATVNWPVAAAQVNNPKALWQAIANEVFKS